MDRRQVHRRLAAARQEVEALEQLLAVEETLQLREAELADAQQYADRLAFVLALGDIGTCLGAAGDRCHHGADAHDAVGIPVPAQRQPALVEHLGNQGKKVRAALRQQAAEGELAWWQRADADEPPPDRA